jgi:hypothetical protein
MGVKMSVINPRETREKLGMNQQMFWPIFRITQSGGSRYECGRPMPGPLKELWNLTFKKKVLVIVMNKKGKYELAARDTAANRQSGTA